tara:strand:- start:33 stop:416 length:384 start_codon:yes stop_codon:yes gene_type:complete
MGCDDAVKAALVAMNMSEVAGTSPANVSVSHAFALFPQCSAPMRRRVARGRRPTPHPSTFFENSIEGANVKSFVSSTPFETRRRTTRHARRAGRVSRQIYHRVVWQKPKAIASELVTDSRFYYFFWQ